MTWKQYIPSLIGGDAHHALKTSSRSQSHLSVITGLFHPESRWLWSRWGNPIVECPAHNSRPGFGVQAAPRHLHTIPRPYHPQYSTQTPLSINERELVAEWFSQRHVDMWTGFCHWSATALTSQSSICNKACFPLGSSLAQLWASVRGVYICYGLFSIILAFEFLPMVQVETMTVNVAMEQAVHGTGTYWDFFINQK